MTSAAPSDRDAKRLASAKVRDVFRLSGPLSDRGTVATVGHIEGMIRIGDTLVLDDCEACVAGIEMLTFADPSAHPSDTVGVPIDDRDEAALRALLGTRVTFRGKV